MTTLTKEQEPVYYEFQWTNPGDQTDQPESLFVWARVVPQWNGTVEQKVEELLAYRYNDKPTYRVRAIYTAPAPQAQPLTDGEIYTAYIEATNQTLRPQDERLALAFARAVLKAAKETQ